MQVRMLRKAATGPDAIEIPPWVPADLRVGYQTIARESDEEEAAGWARRLKGAAPARPASDDLETVRAVVAAARGGLAADALIRRLEADPHKASIVRLWAEGKSTHAIATALDDGTTRNAVIGHLHRLGLNDAMRTTPRRNLPKSPPSKPVAPARRVTASRVVSIRPAPAPVAPPITVVPEPEPPPDGGIAIYDLETHHCRWIVAGEKEHARYCGTERVERADGKPCPYCAGHAALAYDQPVRSERQREADARRRYRLQVRGAA